MMNSSSPLESPAARPDSEFVRWWLIAQAGVWAVLFLYLMTAHLTDGQHGDFGPQWMAGRIVAEGHGRSLYDPDEQEAVLRKYLDQDAVDNLYQSVIGGWLTYPPVQGVLFAPLGALSPRTAQWWMVHLNLAAAVATASALSRTLRGVVSVSVGLLALLSQPAFMSSIAIGQNAALTLAIIVAGWSLLNQGKDVSAGLVWGLLAFKPTWGLAICWVPLVAKRPKAYLGLMTSGVFLVAVSIVLCGAETWLDWLEIARKVEAGYALEPKWRWMRRDLVGLLQHMFGGFSQLVNWGIYGLVVLMTALTLRRSSASVFSGIGGSLFFSAIVLTCPKFMYYDVLIATPGYLLAFSERKNLTRAAFTGVVILAAAFFGAVVFAYGHWPQCWPLETASTLGLWLWSISLILIRGPVGQESETGVVPA